MDPGAGSGDQDLLRRINERFDLVYWPQWAGRDLPEGSVRTMAIQEPDARMLQGKHRYWTPWQDAIAACGFAGVTLLLSVLVGQAGKTSVVKDSAYECGVPTVGKVQTRFSVKFNLTAMLFILFDIEAAFLFPWAVSFGGIGWFGFWSMMVFLAVLTVGFAYEWRKGALEWQ